MKGTYNQTNQPAPQENSFQPSEANSHRRERSLESLSSVDRAFQMMGIWGKATPECSLYDLAQMSN